MANKLYEMQKLTADVSRDVAASPEEWMKFLDTAARLYRYTFQEQLLIYAQRPEATAVASMEIWNKRMYRWINRGSKGIALIDNTSGPRMKLRYVFDIQDTHKVKNLGRDPKLWEMIPAGEQLSAEYLQNLFMSEVFRVYTSSDVLGIELGAALKNVVALAAGIADGLGYGDNTKAALITRGIAEIARLGIVMGGRIETFYGLTGIGDLIVTCTSNHSRNHNAGYLIGQGKSYQEAMDEVKMVVEGVYSAKAALALAKKYNVEVPITEQVNQVLFEGRSAKDAVTSLLMRNRTSECDWS